MQDLFDDIDLEGTETLLSTVSSSCLANIVNTKFEKWKKFFKINLNTDGGKVISAYTDLSKNYMSCISFDVTGPYSVTLNIEGLANKNFGGYEHYGMLGVIDISLFNSIPYITKINVKHDPYILDEISSVVFMNVLDNNIKIDNAFIEKLSQLESISDGCTYIGFQDVTFKENVLQKLDNINTNDITYDLVYNCHYEEECLYPGMEGKMYKLPIYMAFNKDINDCVIRNDFRKYNKLNMLTIPMFVKSPYV